MFDFLFDYQFLRIVWWVLIGALLIAFAVMDGFDLGVGALLPFVAKTDIERRVAINTVGPVWEGNQVWFIVGGGSIFAAWPALYAVSFSGFYLAMFMILAALILRPVGFKYRSKKEDPKWRSRWDMALFIGGAVPALLFGVAVGNTMLGVPFHFTSDLRPIYEGSLIGLLRPAALYCGLVSLSMLVMHGAAWLTFKAAGAISDRARIFGSRAALLTAILFAGGGVLVWAGLLGGYRVTSVIDWYGPSNPLLKTVEPDTSAWFSNFVAYPALWIVPAIGVFGPLLVTAGFKADRQGLTFVASMISIAAIVGTVGVAMFPIILPSISNPSQSLAVFDSSSSRGTLQNMLLVTAIFVPLILIYTAWVYKVLWGKVTPEQIKGDGHSY